MRLQQIDPSNMIEYAIPHSTYAQHLAAAMLFSAWVTAMVMLAGFAMFLYVIREVDHG